jgi:hypothetical protein
MTTASRQMVSDKNNKDKRHLNDQQHNQQLTGNKQSF